MAIYSVSDAVSTYYLYMKYVHPFIFSLCTIIPMGPDDVLRKGSGSLCEALLCVRAYENRIIFPNKQRQEFGKTFKGHLLESETYIGGHVEAMREGIYRADLPLKFNGDVAAYQEVIDDLDRVIKYGIEVEGKLKLDGMYVYVYVYVICIYAYMCWLSL